MHGRTALVLAAVAAVLGGLLWLRQQEADPIAALSVPLFGDVEPSSVVAIRIDNAERNTQVALERDARGAWFLTDPITYPAEPSVVRSLLEVALGNAGLPVEGEAAADVGLDPPRSVMELTWVVGGQRSGATVELGALGLGERDVYVRRDGRILLTKRNFAEVQRRDPDSFRMYAVAPVDERSIIAFSRTGRVPGPGGGRGIDLAAELTSQGWLAEEPYRARLDVHAVALVLRTFSGLRVDRFLDDDASDRLSYYGLDEPLFRFRVVTSRGEEVEVRFGAIDDDALARGDWVCYRVGHPHVFGVSERSVLSLATDLDSLVDYRVSRAPREDVRTIRLDSRTRRVVLEREGSVWRAGVADLDAAGAPGPWRHLRPDRRADPGLVSDLLGALEDAELLELLPDVAWDPAAADGALEVETSDGEVWGGAFGPAASGPGAEGRLFLRRGDTQVSRVEEALHDWVEVSELDLWHPAMHELDATVQTRITLDGAGQRRVYVRSAAGGQWLTEGGGREAPLAFSSRVDDLLHVRARQWLAPDPLAELVEPIAVEVVDREGGERGTTAFLLARQLRDPVDPRAAHPAGGRAVCLEDGAWAEVDAGTHADLWALLGGG